MTDWIIRKEYKPLLRYNTFEKIIILKNAYEKLKKWENRISIEYEINQDFWLRIEIWQNYIKFK